jgi:molybdate transport system substrate-binding protein
MKTLLIAAAFLLLLPFAALAQQLHVITSGGVRGAYEAALPDFQRATGVTVSTGTGGSQGDGPTTIGAQLRRGVHADVVLMSREGLSELLADGRVVAGTAVDLAQTPLAMAVRAGAAHPDISTADSVRRALVGATGVALLRSTTGLYMVNTMFPRLGIADVVQQKLSSQGAAAVARGEADFTLQPLSELVRAEGVEVVGNLPGDLQFVSVFSAAIVSGAEHADAAKRLVTFLASKEADEAFAGYGMERVKR